METVRINEFVKRNPELVRNPFPWRFRKIEGMYTEPGVSEEDMMTSNYCMEFSVCPTCFSCPLYTDGVRLKYEPPPNVMVGDMSKSGEYLYVRPKYSK